MLPIISAQFVPPTDILEAVNEQLSRVPALMGRTYKRNLTRLAQRKIVLLKVEPGAPPDGITNLMTPRQRRAFWATNGFGGGIPHERTHAIANGWLYSVEAADDGGVATIYNDVPGINYVEGYDQQFFLAFIGWPYAPPILDAFAVEAEDVTIESWYSIADPFAGAQG